MGSLIGACASILILMYYDLPSTIFAAASPRWKVGMSLALVRLKKTPVEAVTSFASAFSTHCFDNSTMLKNFKPYESERAKYHTVTKKINSQAKPIKKPQCQLLRSLDCLQVYCSCSWWLHVAGERWRQASQSSRAPDESSESKNYIHR